MYFKIISAVILLIQIISFSDCEVLIETVQRDYYIAGVVEYCPEKSSDINPDLIIQENLDTYTKLIDEAGTKNVDILVFPEATFNYVFTTRDLLLKFAWKLPDPKNEIVSCDDQHLYQNELNIFCRNIRKNKIYTLLNVVEKENCNGNENCASDGFNMFNTNIVFDRDGNIISKYRKYNLYIEPHMNSTIEPQLATFKTDFGVEFGHIICFDIMFKSPAVDLIQMGIKHMLYPTMWFSALPFYTANQVQQGFSYAHDVTLLVAGANEIEVGSSGSGVFNGRNGAMIILNPPVKTIKLLTAKVFIDSSRNSNKTEYVHRYTPKEMDQLNIMPILQYEKTDKLSKDEINLCNNDICCEFNMKYNEIEIPREKIGYKYRVVMGSEIREFGENNKMKELLCAIVACRTDNSDECGQRFKDSSNLIPSIQFDEITIKMKLKSNFGYNNVYPSNLDFNILPLNVMNFTFNSIKNEINNDIYQINSVGMLNNLLAFGMYGRNFTSDVKELQFKLI